MPYLKVIIFPLTITVAELPVVTISVSVSDVQATVVSGSKGARVVVTRLVSDLVVSNSVNIGVVATVNIGVVVYTGVVLYIASFSVVSSTSPEGITPVETSSKKAVVFTPSVRVSV